MALKFYVVWAGRQTGVFTEWATAQRSIDKFAGARFKSFPTRAEAEAAFQAGSDKAVKATRSGKAGPSKGKSAPDATREFDVRIFCDGACEPNPGEAGSGIVVYRDGKLAELWYGLYNPAGTNNTAELGALYHALRMAEVELRAGQSVEICSDSMYSIQCIRDWAPGWERKGWRKSVGEIRNLEIIQACYAIYRRLRTELQLTHVSAHVGTEGNELADRMAMLGSQSKETELRRFEKEIDVAKLLKMRAG